MPEVEIRILPEADDFLTSLADVLVRGINLLMNQLKGWWMKLLTLFLIWLLFLIIKYLLLQNIIFPDLVKTCGMLSLIVKVLLVLRGMFFLKSDNRILVKHTIINLNRRTIYPINIYLRLDLQ